MLIIPKFGGYSKQINGAVVEVKLYYSYEEYIILESLERLSDSFNLHFFSFHTGELLSDIPSCS